MNGRRGFFAFIGSTAVTGLVAQRASAAQPTLILPTRTIIPAASDLDFPLVERAMAHDKYEWKVVVRIRQTLPDDLFSGWLENGLRMAEQRKSGCLIARVMEADRAAASFGGTGS